jgi:hypothetical protein
MRRVLFDWIQMVIPHFFWQLYVELEQEEEGGSISNILKSKSMFYQTFNSFVAMRSNETGLEYQHRKSRKIRKKPEKISEHYGDYDLLHQWN